MKVKRENAIRACAVFAENGAMLEQGPHQRELAEGADWLFKNVRLVDAAPDLLKAAEAAATFLESFRCEWEELTDRQHGKWEGDKFARRLRKAIAKASGK